MTILPSTLGAFVALYVCTLYTVHTLHAICMNVCMYVCVLRLFQLCKLQGIQCVMYSHSRIQPYFGVYRWPVRNGPAHCGPISTLTN